MGVLERKGGDRDAAPMGQSPATPLPAWPVAMIPNSLSRARLVARPIHRPGRAHGAACVLAAVLAGSAVTAQAVEPLVQHDVVLLQAGSIIEQRVEGGANAMADYVRRLGDAATEAVRAN